MARQELDRCGRTEREKYYEALLDEQEESGLSVAAFADQTDLSAAMLYSWRRRLGRAATRGASSALLEVCASEDRSRVGSSGSMVLALSDGIRIELEPAAGTVAAWQSAPLALTSRTAGLRPGLHEGRIHVRGNAPNAPMAIDLRLTVNKATGAPSQPTQTTVEPQPPIAEQGARTWYASSGGPLAAAPAILCYWGLHGWDPATIVDGAMTAAGGDMWFLDLPLPVATWELDFVFHDGAGTWDNNSGQDWKLPVVP